VTVAVGPSTGSGQAQSVIVVFVPNRLFAPVVQDGPPGNLTAIPSWFTRLAVLTTNSK